MNLRWVFGLLAITLIPVPVCLRADQTREALTGGTFESDVQYWNYNPYPGGSATSSGIFSGPNAYAGQWYAYLGSLTVNDNNADGYIDQYLQPSPDAADTYVDLSFYLNVTSQDTSNTAHDTLKVYLRFFDSNLTFLYDELLASYSNKDRNTSNNAKIYARKQVTYEFSNFVPGYKMLIFKVKTDGTQSTTFRIDNVSATIGRPDPVPMFSVQASVEGGHGAIEPSGTFQVSEDDDVNFAATPDQYYTVDKWNVNGSTAKSGGTAFRLNSVGENTTVTVSFVRTYRLDVTVLGQGSYTLEPPGGVYTAGTRITATSTPNSGYIFSEWEGARYRQISSFSFEKGGSDEALTLRFIPHLWNQPVSLTTAQSTPMTIGLPMSTSWLTICETCSDMSSPFWVITRAFEGQDPASFLDLSQLIPPQFVRTVQVPSLNTPGFLEFPIRAANGTPQAAPVTAIMDHSIVGAKVRADYVHDHAIRTLNGDTFEVLVPNRVKGERFSFRVEPFSFVPKLTYTGVEDESQRGPQFLQYDGHSGYDYGYGEGTPVYAAAAGDIIVGGDADDCSAEGLALANYYMKHRHALIIKHDDTGYCTVYMHLSEIASEFADTDDWFYWKTKAGRIERGQYLGKTGKFLSSCDGTVDDDMGPHFHFEVWRKANDSWHFADPYGFQGPQNVGLVLFSPVLWD